MGLASTAVLIDAGYLSKISSYLGRGRHLKLDLVKFGKYLAVKNGLWMKEIYYYTAPPFQGTPPTPDETTRKASYDKFLVKMSRLPEVTIREGRLQKIGADFTQKGVDTLVVMDLMRLAASKRYQKIVLLACDTDFVPIILKLKEEELMWCSATIPIG